MKIKSLTPEQEATFPFYVDKWLKIGLSCEPCNFEASKDAAIRAYKVAGLPPPTQFFHATGPINAAEILRDLGLKKTPKGLLDNTAWGAHDAGWLAFQDFFLRECKLECCEKLIPLMDLAENCGWWNPYDTAVIFQDRPKHIKFDPERRLHCEDGPSILYRDGLEVYSWHGTRVPKQWIMDRPSLTPSMALHQENMELRRCACEIIGWARILKELNAKIIDRGKTPFVGDLLEVDIPDIGPEKFLRVMCGTDREFALPVPPDMTTAEDSQRWLNFIPEGSNVSAIPQVRT